MSKATLFANGIDGETGEPALPPIEVSELAHIITGQEVDPGLLAELKQKRAQSAQHFGIMDGYDPTDLAEAGWGVVFVRAKKGTPEYARQEQIRDALKPLLRLRQSQAGRIKGTRYREFLGYEGFDPAMRKNDWLTARGIGPGPADPDIVPYYLLLVGDPSEIDFRSQGQLDVQYAVGRIHFDEIEDYARYAQSVVDAETKPSTRSKKAAFWGAKNPDDGATQLSAPYMVSPLAEWTRDKFSTSDWEVHTRIGDQAHKRDLARLLGGDETPSLLFTASHGMSFRSGHNRQHKAMGALLCQDWPGPKKHRGAIPEGYYFAGEDLKGAGSLEGLITFMFACFGAGTPTHDDFARQAMKNKRAQLAPSPFVSDLPKRMLSHDKGGALAVIGHVDRAWGHSFVWEGSGGRGGDDSQLTVFKSTLHRLIKGDPVGYALEQFNERYAELASDLTVALEERDFGDPRAPDDYALAAMWTANNDARGYAIIGDPAVRLQVDGPKATVPDPIELHSVAAPAASVEPASNDASGSIGASEVDFSASSTGSRIVRTWTSGAPEPGGSVPTDASLYATTTISPEGDVDTVVSDNGDPALAQLHASIVRAARREQ